MALNTKTLSLQKDFSNISFANEHQQISETDSFIICLQCPGKMSISIDWNFKNSD